MKVLAIGLLLSLFWIASIPLQAQDHSETTRYHNPIVFGRTHLDENSGKILLGSKLWIMEEDGAGLRQLTFGTTYDDHPSLYSDKEHVLYAEFPTNLTSRFRNLDEDRS